MKKLFIFILIALLILQMTGCTQGFFVGEAIVSASIDELLNESDNQHPSAEINEDENEEGSVEEEPDEEDNIVEDDINEENTDAKNDDELNNNQGEEPAEPVMVQFNTMLPPEIRMELRYDKYPMAFDYLLVLEAANVRKGPGLNEEIIDVLQANEKVSLIAEVKGKHLEEGKVNSWYKIEWQKGEEVKTGYIYATLGEVRRFQFDKMNEVLNYLKGESVKGELAHISNYKNVNGLPPLFKGNTWDEYGYRRSQSAPGYENPQKGSNFRYIPDGMLISVLEEKDGFSKVKVIGWEGEYWVPNKYINSRNIIRDLNKVIIVDRTFQNQGVFEFIEGQWALISYSLATTGKKGSYSLETPLGYYMAIQKRDRFLYYKDGTQIIAGYAPYAIRFSGGGYIHGVPVDYIIKNGRRIDPGMKEYMSTIGTIPRSHMCVRNFTSHAQFIYDWIEIGSSAIVVIE